TLPKEAALEFEASGGRVRVGGIAKGAGMIRPRMATMLAFLATDAWVEGALLQRLLSRAVEETFNCITVDGETSTNDSVICLANGASGITLSEAAPLGAALEEVCSTLAQAIVRDGEGATKFVEVRVRGALTPQEAKQAAMAIANSLLVKTALFGEDPNWGRILAAAGASGARLNPERLTLEVGGVKIAEGGRAASGQWEEPARKALKEKSISLCLDMGLGQGESRVWTTDLSTDYVNLNARYST
ncbi:MAG: bifunctional ornithine acetyltransferase/N-acetylglutamate synthase, partial [Nitrospinota bacterium]